MESIKHNTVSVNGINMHIAEKGEGPLVLFLHGFPELWYSWRHQILFMAANGYRAVAPDLRGYGDTTGAPLDDPTKFSILHLVADVVALLDAIAPPDDKAAFVVCQDWGAVIAWDLCLYRPDKVKALVSLGAPFVPRNPHFSMVDGVRALFGDDHFICRFQEPGEIEIVLKRVGAKAYIKKVMTHCSADQIIMPKGNELGDETDASIPLPSWLSEEDIDYVANKFEETGFTGAVNYYRASTLSWELTGAWSGAQVHVPVKLILGDRDPLFPLFKEGIYNGQFKKDVPFSEEVVLLEGVAHFINQESPNEVNKYILDFLCNF